MDWKIARHGFGALLSALALGPAAAGQAAAQAANRPPQASPAAPPADPAQPERTAAAYGDWTLRCETLVAAAGAPGRACEVTQTVLDQRGQPIAQLALGRPPGNARLALVAQLPVNAAVDQAARLLPGDAGQPVLTLPFRNCQPRGCFAQSEPTDAELGTMRRRAEPLRLEYQDAARSAVALPVSLRGLTAALDALEREGRADAQPARPR